MKYMGVNDKYELSVVPIEETELLYSAQLQIRDHEIGCIGHMRQDYGRDGKGFWTSWTDHCPEFKTQAFKDEFDDIINTLRSGFLKSRAVMTEYCNGHSQAKLNHGRESNYAFRIITDNHVYYLRCCTLKNENNLYVYAYNRNRLAKWFPTQAYTELTAELKSKLEKAAEFILETAARETRTGSYILYPNEIPAEIISPAIYIKHIDIIEVMLNNYDAIEYIMISPSNAFYVDIHLAYCSNYEPSPEEADDYPNDIETLDPLKSKRVPVTDSQPLDDVETKPSLMSRLAENKEKAARQERTETHKPKETTL